MLNHCIVTALYCLSLVGVQAFSPLAVSRHQQQRSFALHVPNEDSENDSKTQQVVSRRGLLEKTIVSTGAAVLISTLSSTQPASARLESVNRPDLLPKESGVNVIQTEKILTTGQAKRMNDLLTALERDTGFRVRVICQNYPNTPGLALRDYWDLAKEGQKDDKYVVMVVDQFGGSANILNFNVGGGVDLNLPTAFFRRLQSKYGTTFYVRENGMDLAVVNAIEAIVTCLRSEQQYCVDVPADMPSMKSLGLS